MPIQRTDLRAYQDMLASKLAAAEAGASIPESLGFEAGGQCWLIDLPAAGEVLPLPALEPVPLTRPWFAGLANVRGELYGVLDLPACLGHPPTPRTPACRLLCVGQRLGARLALLVPRVHGLMRSAELKATGADDTAPAWQGRSYEDANGIHWRRLQVEFFLADEAFRDAAALSPSAP